MDIRLEEAESLLFTQLTATSIKVKPEKSQVVKPKQDGLYLPDEVIKVILEYQLGDPLNTSRHALTTCALVSTSWNRVATRLLYQHVHIYTFVELLLFGRGCHRMQDSLHPIHSLYIRPSLRILHSSSLDYTWQWIYQLKQIVMMDLRALSYIPITMDQFYMILAHCPLLKHVLLSHVDTSVISVLDMPLHSLDTCIIAPGTVSLSYKMKELSAKSIQYHPLNLFNKNQVESMYCDIVLPLDVGSTFTRLTHLHLHKCGIEDDAFIAMIQQLSCLKALMIMDIPLTDVSLDALASCQLGLFVMRWVYTCSLDSILNLIKSLGPRLLSLGIESIPLDSEESHQNDLVDCITASCPHLMTLEWYSEPLDSHILKSEKRQELCKLPLKWVYIPHYPQGYDDCSGRFHTLCLNGLQRVSESRLYEMTYLNPSRLHR